MIKYSQIVRHLGNIPLFDILDVSVTGSFAGVPIHVHAEGLRGTGKTTIVRAYKEVLPKINRIKGCLYNCDPLKPHCPEHRNLLYEEIENIGIETISMPFLEISPSAKKGTVVGTIDLKKLSSEDGPEAALLLGTIPKAHRGIIFVDEINRIADTSPEIADILLDVMGTKPGRIQIEEAGLPVTEIPVQVSVWSASNPDEDPGPLEDIRRQLSDRFDFTVNVERPTDTSVIDRIFNGEKQYNNTIINEKTTEFLQAGKNLDRFEPTQEMRELFASLYVDYCIESLRFIEAALLGTKIRGALLNRKPNIDDVVFITRHALRHRVEIKDLNTILINLEQREHIMKKAQTALKTPAQNENKIIVSSKVPEANNDKKQKPTNHNYGLLKNMLRRFAGNLRPTKSKKPNESVSKSDYNKIDMKAPPEKALSIGELDITEYVKTEEELIR